MAATYRNIAQISPAAATNTDLYTCPAASTVVISTLLVCNQNTTNQTFRVAVRSGVAASGASLAAIGSTATPSGSAWIFYDTLVYANSTLAVTLGLTLTDTEVVTVRSSATNVSFLLFGSVITA